jgi:uncharacterized SAM-binding protein YcdF (DUF218 family)
MKIIKLLSVTTSAFWLAILIPIAIWAGGYIVFTGTVANMMEPKTLEKTDTMIALTGGTNRITRALDLLTETKTRHLLISGVHKDVKLKELLSLWKYDQKKLPKCCIDLGYSAGNTLENAIEARNWVRAKNATSIRLITANYHMPRSLLEFHHAIPEAQIIPHAVTPEDLSARELKFWRLCFIEYHKFLLSFVRILFYPAELNPVLPPLRT